MRQNSAGTNAGLTGVPTFKSGQSVLMSTLYSVNACQPHKCKKEEDKKSSAYFLYSTA